MKRIHLILIALFITNLSQAQSVLFECGQNSGQNFNGWYISPTDVFDAVEFDDHSTSFYSENGGNFAVTLTRQIEEMTSFEELSILFNFENTHNCDISNVTYYTSTDGKNWAAINDSRNNSASLIRNDSNDIKYVRATANSRFSDNGTLACNYVKIEGRTNKPVTLTTINETEDLFEETFFIFSHEHNINIETALEKPYEVLITSITGQIVFREAFEGSNRIELPADLTGIFIVTVIQDNDFQATKKIII